MQGLQKYRVGIVVLAAATLVLLVYVIIQSGSYKEDRQTNETASSIAEDLNQYIRDNSKIPDSLDEATSQDVPDSITYTNNDDGTYTFCTTYNSGSDGSSLDANEILLQGLSGSYAVSSTYESSYTPSTLYISSSGWSSGEQCVDVEPNIYVPSNRFNNIFDAYCDPMHSLYQYYEDSCVDGKYIY